MQMTDTQSSSSGIAEAEKVLLQFTYDGADSNRARKAIGTLITEINRLQAKVDDLQTIVTEYRERAREVLQAQIGETKSTDALIEALEQAVCDRLANCSKGPELQAARKRLREALTLILAGEVSTEGELAQDIRKLLEECHAKIAEATIPAAGAARSEAIASRNELLSNISTVLQD
jgi:hypothetical protein